MARIFNGPMRTCYGQIYVTTGGCGDLILESCFRGQTNGLCGAAVRGGLTLMTGLHTGWVHLTVEVLESEPPIEPSWEEIVEVPFQFLGPSVALEDFEGQVRCSIPNVSDGFRARYCARGFGLADELGRIDDTEPTEYYSLSLWPSPVQGDTVVKQTRPEAAYWHSFARGLEA